MYERKSVRRITWWSKDPDGKTRVLRAVPVSASPEQIAQARQAAIAMHGIYGPGGRQARVDGDVVAGWMENAGIAQKEAVRIRKGLPEWALQLHTNSKRRAEGRNIQWAVSKSDFAAIVERSAGLCEVSGIPLSLTLGGQKGPYGPSIDRISARAGYVPSNVRIVCIAVNFALNSWGLDAFLPVARALVARHSDSKRSILEFEAIPKLAGATVEPLEKLAEWTGLEPATPGVTGRG